MKLFGLCLIFFAKLLAGAYSETISTAALANEEAGNNFRETRSTTRNVVAFESETELTQEESGLEIFEKFVTSLLGHNDGTSQVVNTEEGRTFGVKRLQFMLMPMIYKMGVMMTLLVVLTVISLKGLAVGVLLLVLKLSAFFGQLYAHSHAPSHGWSSQPQPVHVHVHNNGGVSNHPSPHTGWESVSGYNDDENYYYKG